MELYVVLYSLLTKHSQIVGLVKTNICSSNLGWISICLSQFSFFLEAKYGSLLDIKIDMILFNYFFSPLLACTKYLEGLPVALLSYFLLLLTFFFLQLSIFGCFRLLYGYKLFKIKILIQGI